MRTQDFFMVRSSGAGGWWKYQMALGVMLVLASLAIVAFPEILVILVAAGILTVGVGLIGSAWMMRRIPDQPTVPSVFETFEWWRGEAMR